MQSGLLMVAGSPLSHWPVDAAGTRHGAFAKPWGTLEPWLRGLNDGIIRADTDSTYPKYARNELYQSSTTTAIATVQCADVGNC